jgi:MFS family permease
MSMTFQLLRGVGTEEDTEERVEDPLEERHDDDMEPEPDATGTPSGRMAGMRGYTVVWFGQLISIIGTGMTQFGLVIWMWAETGSATSVALVAFFGFVPNVVMMPFAGVLVDRWNRKRTIALTDLTAGIASTGILVLFLAESLEYWHIYILVAFAGLFQAFQFPAFSAATTLMVKKKHYARASSMVMMAQATSMILAPIFAALLLGFSDLSAILMTDVATFLVALGLLAIVPIPELEKKGDEDKSLRSVVTGITFGFQYILSKKGLLGLQLILFSFNVIGTFAVVLLSLMILAKTGDDKVILATVLSIGATGGIVGGAVMAIWGGPKVRVHGVFIGLTVAASGGLVIGVGTHYLHWAVGMFIFMSTIALTNGSNQSIWQSKVPPEKQGRVFATRAFIATMGIPLSQLMAGPLADWLEEVMMETSGVVEVIFGSGPGTGMALIIFVVGGLGMVVGLAGYLFPNVRYIDDRMPDHEKAAADDEEDRKADGELEAEEEIAPTPLEELEKELEKDPGG